MLNGLSKLLQRAWEEWEALIFHRITYNLTLCTYITLIVWEALTASRRWWWSIRINTENIGMNTMLWWQGTLWTFSCIILSSQCPRKVDGVVPIWQTELHWRGWLMQPGFIPAKPGFLMALLESLTLPSRERSPCICFHLVPLPAEEQHDTPSLTWQEIPTFLCCSPGRAPWKTLSMHT